LHGDLEEFSRLVGIHAPRMLSLALGIVHRRDAAEDVVQEALVKAYEKLGSWRGDSSLGTWLHRIVYTTAVSSLRGQRIVADAAALPDLGEEEGEWEVTEANIARMRRAIGELSPADRAVVTLFYLEERSVREVAAIVGEKEGAVKVRLHRARARLRAIMINDG
jgi:RNA polymerase sigma-70 factor (ECF subfamily)